MGYVNITTLMIAEYVTRINQNQFSWNKSWWRKLCACHINLIAWAYFGLPRLPLVYLSLPLVLSGLFHNSQSLMHRRTEFNQGLALIPYSPRFHSLRRLIHKELTGIMLQKYWPLHEDESRTLVKKVLQDPDAFLDSIRQ